MARSVGLLLLGLARTASAADCAAPAGLSDSAAVTAYWGCLKTNCADAAPAFLSAISGGMVGSCAVGKGMLGGNCGFNLKTMLAALPDGSTLGAVCPSLCNQCAAGGDTTAGTTAAATTTRAATTAATTAPTTTAATTTATTRAATTAATTVATTAATTTGTTVPTTTTTTTPAPKTLFGKVTLSVTNPAGFAASASAKAAVAAGIARTLSIEPDFVKVTLSAAARRLAADGRQLQSGSVTASYSVVVPASVTFNVATATTALSSGGITTLSNNIAAALTSASVTSFGTVSVTSVVAPSQTTTPAPTTKPLETSSAQRAGLASLAVVALWAGF